MRELKFRAWDTQLKSWTDGRRALLLETRDVVIEQFTGLKDKNGQDIFEGDIVKESSHLLEAEVVYDGRFAGYKLAAANSLAFYLEQCAFLEVVGNIHETWDKCSYCGEALKSWNRSNHDSKQCSKPIKKVERFPKMIGCLHDNCPKCHGSGRDEFGRICVHSLSCPCPKCTPTF